MTRWQTDHPMSDDSLSDTTPKEAPAARADHTIGSSTIYRLCEEVIALREMNNRQHKLFEQALQKSRDAVQGSFNSFAADTQRAFQQLRQEVHGEKRVSLALLNALLDIGFDMERLAASWRDHLAATRPTAELPEAVAEWVQAVEGWAEAVQVEARRVQDILQKNGVHRYDAVIGSAYDPALHERVGSCRAEGMPPLRVAEQREHGYASKQPEFVLRRPKVLVSE
jgi:molecular chaperone GrpE (heat shock protein)